MEETQLDELQWKSPEWIQSFGLRTDNVLEYFSQSPFFDRTSNNQVVKMQQQYSQNDGQVYIPHYTVIEQELKKMKGVEYVLAFIREPDFWIIRKQNRSSVDKVSFLQTYYIVGANVYQCPSAGKIVSSRLLASVHNLSNAMSKLNKLAKFDPSQGHSYVLENACVKEAPKPSVIGRTPGRTPAISGQAAETVGGNTVASSSRDGAKTGADLSAELMEKLMWTSIKSNPVYLDDLGDEQFHQPPSTGDVTGAGSALGAAGRRLRPQ